MVKIRDKKKNNKPSADSTENTTVFQRIEGWSEIILDSIVEGAFTVDEDWNITWFNAAAERITGFSKQDALGSKCFEIFRSTCCEKGCILGETFRTKKRITGKQVNIIKSDGTSIPISISTAILRNNEDEIVGGVETFRDLSEIKSLRKELEKNHSFQDIISSNDKMRELFQILPRISETDTTILLQGASGTGKELFARAIHNSSKRKNNPFIIVNCAAIPENLMESELFGHQKGSFTGAVSSRDGWFKLADKGTIFLDEIGELPLHLQSKLLRVLAEKYIDPIGSTKSQKIDVRVIAATNRNLEKEVELKKFRDDLYYRLNVITLDLPPLKKRKDDIPLLVNHFLCKFSYIKGHGIKELDSRVMNILLEHDWPGNIRELSNVIEHLVILSTNEIIFFEDLPSYLKKKYKNNIVFTRGMTLAEIEKNAVINALKNNDYKIMKTSRELNIDKNTLKRKIKKYDIKLK